MNDRIDGSPPRLDGPAKVSGATRYVDDLKVEGMLHGATKRSPHPRARITSLQWHPERAPKGSVFVSAADIPGQKGLQILDDSWPVLAGSEVNHVGEAVALVAAPTRREAIAALDAIEVEYEPLDAATDWEGADGLDPLHELELAQGDASSAIAAADLVVEGEYFMGHQEHIYIECQGIIAQYEADGSVLLRGSLQCPFYVNRALSLSLGLPPEKVRVLATPLGGGFGGKEDYPSLLGAHAALLARKSGKPVKIVYDRHEDIVATTKRHPARVRIRSAVTGTGELLALALDVDMDGGAYLGLSPVVLSRGVLHASGAYRWPCATIRGRVLRTHTVPTGAFRGFGAPQVEFAIERHMDCIARSLGMSPLELRRRNVLKPGDALPTGQVMDESCAADLVLEKVAELTDFEARWRELEDAREDGAPRAGVGLALFFHGAGFTGLGEHRMRSPVTARLTEDGRLELLTAATEMGQGAHSVLPLIAARAAGLRVEDIVLAPPDTALVPDSGPTVASRTSMIVGGAVARAAREMRESLIAWKTAGGTDRAKAESIGFADLAREYLASEGELELTVHNEPPDWQQFDEATYHGAAYPTYSWGSEVIEVDVDPDTFEVRPRKATVVCDVGAVLHPVLCEGQIAGGTLQGIGYALFEEMKVEAGRYLNDRMATYIIPTIGDAPIIDVHMLERPWNGEPFGAKGVGELPMDGAAPAALAAIENATGFALSNLPATPERLYEESTQRHGPSAGQRPQEGTP